MNWRFFIPLFLCSLAGCNLWQGCDDDITIPKITAFTQLATDLFPLTASALQKQAACVAKNIPLIVQEIISQKPASRTFETTFRRLDQLAGYVRTHLITWTTLQMASPDCALRNAAQQAVVDTTSLTIDYMSNNKELYHALKAYNQARPATELLTPEQERFITETLREFERAGLHLPDDQLARARAIKKELNQLEVQFETNISNHQEQVPASLSDLQGLQESFINALPQDPAGNYLISLSYSIIFEVLENCTVDTTREKVWLALVSRAYPANELILNRIIALRHELAQRLGFKNFVALDLDDQMIKTGDRAQEFLTKLVDRAIPKMDREFALIKENIATIPGVTLVDGLFKPWDVSYSFNNYKRKFLQIDDRLVAEYFPVPQTVERLLAVFSEFFGLEFRREPVTGLWSPEVEGVGVYYKDGPLIGYLLLDLFPRPFKTPLPCQALIVPAHRATATGLVDRPSVAVILASFPRANADQPALLKFSDVTTFCHEFGHSMQALCGATDMASFSGTGVIFDSIEIASQTLEECIIDPAILKRVSGHYKTGAPLDDALIARLREIRQFDSGYYIARQASLARFALACFADATPKRAIDLKEIFYGPAAKYVFIDPRAHFECGFTHLMDYASKYYAYLLDKTIACAFVETINSGGPKKTGRLGKNGFLDYTMGRRYIDRFLGRGGSEDPAILVKDFIGGPATPEAFFKLYGL
jgi:Zn-dependent oligopeptidase